MVTKTTSLACASLTHHLWYPQLESNQRPLRCQRSVLPLNYVGKVIMAEGIEPSSGRVSGLFRCLSPSLERCCCLEQLSRLGHHESFTHDFRTRTELLTSCPSSLAEDVGVEPIVYRVRACRATVAPIPNRKTSWFWAGRNTRNRHNSLIFSF